MKINDAGLALIKAHEGLRLEAYKDPVGVWTIGFGHTAAAGPPAPSSGMKITKAEADAILRRDLASFERAVDAAVKVPLNANQFSALVSFCFNVGEGAFRKSSVLKAVTARNFSLVQGKLARWNKAGRKVLPGLTRRRKEEAELFMKPVAKPAAVPVDRPKPVEPVPVPAHDYNREEVRVFQRLLLGHGYVTVGGVDGLVGDSTRSVVRDFRAANGLPEGEHLDDDLLAALRRPDAVRPVIMPDRANATLSDLRAKDSEIVKGTDWQKVGTAGAAAGTAVKPVSDILTDSGEEVSGFVDTLTPFQSFIAFFSEGAWVEWIWVPVLIIVAIVGWKAFAIARARLRDHRLNNTAIVNLTEHT